MSNKCISTKCEDNEKMGLLDEPEMMWLDILDKKRALRVIKLINHKVIFSFSGSGWCLVNISVSLE